MKKFAAIALVATVWLMAACGGGAPEEEAPVSADPADVRELTIVDSIGVELGDSNYVLGALSTLCFGPEGNLYAFDLVRGSVMVYDEEGVFQRRISRRGEGPGEITFPLDMTVLNNGDVMITALGGIHRFSPQGEHQGIYAEYFSNPPMNLTAVGDSTLLASKLTIVPDDDNNPYVEYWLATLDESGEQDVTYATDRMLFDPQNLTEMLNRTWMAYSIAADREGNVYLAPNSSEEFRIDVYGPDGQLIRTVQKDYPRVEKTEQEIREEKAWMEMRLENMGVNGVVIDFEPDPFRRMVTDLGIDGEGRVWARRGTELSPVFEVFSFQGEHLFTAGIPGVGDRGQFWRFAMEENGMAAFSTNPETYQKIYLLELQ